MGGRGSSSRRSKTSRVPKGETVVAGNDEVGYLTDRGLKEIEEAGGKRWTKGKHDRLYINGMAEKIGGFVRKTSWDRKGRRTDEYFLDGEEESGRQGRWAESMLRDVFINLNTMESNFDSYTNTGGNIAGKVTDKCIAFVKQRLYKKK